MKEKSANTYNGIYMGSRKNLLFPINPSITKEIFSGKFSDEQIRKMTTIRRKIASGEINEHTPETLRLGFVCWLIAHDRLKS